MRQLILSLSFACGLGLLQSANAQTLPSQKILDTASKAVFQVRARNCGGTDRTGTGFLSKQRDWVVTALHVVAGCQALFAWSEQDRKERRLTLLRVDRSGDLALLQIGDPPAVAPLPWVTGKPAVNSELSALGYPLEAPRMQSMSLKVRWGSMQLEGLLADNLAKSLTDSAGPSIKIEILNVEGHLLPGMSGGPVLDADGKVVGIGNGGLERGSASISWAIPAQRLEILIVSTDPINTFTANTGQLPSSLFAADMDSKIRASAKCGNFEVVHTRTRSFPELTSTVDDPLGMQQLSTRVGFDQQNFRYDIWEELLSGATFVVPEGWQLTSGNTKNSGSLGHCVARNSITRHELHIYLTSVLQGNFNAELAFETEMARLAPAWVPDQSLTYFAPIQRFDGLLLTRKTMIGLATRQPNAPARAYVFEMLGRRGQAFLGVAAVDPAVDMAQSQHWWGRCVTLTYPEASCDALAPFYRTWAQVALSVQLATFRL